MPLTTSQVYIFGGGDGGDADSGSCAKDAATAMTAANVRSTSILLSVGVGVGIFHRVSHAGKHEGHVCEQGTRVDVGEERKAWGPYIHLPCIQPAAVVIFREALSTANSNFQTAHARTHTVEQSSLNMVQEKVEFRTRRARVIMRQAGGWYGTLSHQAGGRRVFAISHRYIEEVLPSLTKNYCLNIRLSSHHMARLSV